MDDPQQRVAAFVADKDLSAPPAYRLLDLVSETGELAKEANESTGYGTDPDAIDLSADELGDVYFSLLALAEAADVDAEAALSGALAKYERRLEEGDTAGSGG
ncbi:putative pyrophosphatase [Salinarchaeum sp. Harcht-Bsk1]|uniref:MazG-like family protein n=1 Tax=Salinarchaeum sp. Harcht-Bsk1 TaxID=1333523 RepID=UPI0003424705|nr:MazG-like family protein [Salinarchaeum sp. Harcht-Bsk1]AGN01021.1 putative pyrophosphatase [Salinarchaeum sp. Harcht-Bsk1]